MRSVGCIDTQYKHWLMRGEEGQVCFTLPNYLMSGIRREEIRGMMARAGSVRTDSEDEESVWRGEGVLKYDDK